MPDELAVVRDWFERRTHRPGAVDVADLVALKAGRRVSVVLPARDEEATVGAIVRAVHEQLVTTGLVDEVLVVDSRSADGTAAEARAAGAVVHATEDADDLDGGKGAALRTGVARMSGDVGVLLDADVRDFGVDFVLGLLGPLLADDSVLLVKGFYDRPWTGDAAEAPSGPVGGGRVTELVARPLIAERTPLLAGFVQPLSGECAFVRGAVAGQRFGSGYAVDVVMLLQTVLEHGLDATAQVDLGRRVHRHQDLAALGRMALQVRAAFDLVLDDREVVELERAVPVRGADGGTSLATESVRTWLLPPP